MKHKIEKKINDKQRSTKHYIYN